MQQFLNQHDYIIYQRKNNLKKDSNHVGIILLLFFAVMMGVSLVTVLPLMMSSMFSNNADPMNMETAFLEDTVFIMLQSGFVSLVAFFLVSLIYCLIAKVNLGKIFPLDKLPSKFTYLICTFGLAVAMVSNYVSNLTIALFDLFGINAYVDINYECDSALDVFLFYVTVAVLPALVEEFAFRGVILGLLRKHSDSLAILVSGIMFGLMHGNFTQIPFATAVGLILGFIAVKANSLIPCIIVHFLNNALSVTQMLISEYSGLSQVASDTINILITLVVCGLGIISFIILSSKYKGFFIIKEKDNHLSFAEKSKIVFTNPLIITFSALMLFEAIATLGLGSAV